eukprot:818500-Amphidinium_carterae.1
MPGAYSGVTRVRQLENLLNPTNKRRDLLSSNHANLSSRSLALTGCCPVNSLAIVEPSFV